MKSVLISIQPKWCELIASGEKTVEVRKTKPKIETPFKCYIYCTKDNSFAEKTLRGFDENGKAIYYKAHKGKVIGEFVCDSIFPISCYCSDINARWMNSEQPYTCLTDKEMINYLGNGVEGYGWHITDLVIYDKPKELSEFERACPDNVRSCAMCRHSGYSGMKCTPLKSPPQSWCYVEGENNEHTD